MAYHAIEDRIEEAIESLLRVKVSGDVNMYLPLNEDEPAEPWCAIGCVEVKPLFPEAPDSGHLVCSIELAIRTHNEPLEDSAGNVLRTARQLHSDVVGQVVDVFYSDTLVSDLHAQSVQDLMVSRVEVQERRRGPAENSIVTQQKILVECSPYERGY